ncbi:bifunctional diaminohydroxyphosphoribosylaminopyrimidine deaminase/5-amino-6-(5-phosphoribosylamino)uracil reductase RibD [Candidatus Pantoea edessiphila]|uniref:Riboflavin biosynthesis protein RibD n=1 Tax=Candidatus Pantoea edessiphila TaxID=2044610 RepID=A0A2P5SVJ7_9GAMM|nr:bifunctional diaminohydroxyphosphoribosylaminopyrimidine deaminase/5-amino-6-(5-phosphoribosylamino)uracil reductase RibD [Candidatus Pantoea edessiphila]PPI86343.1 riboflavin biosynthesis protein RibD [Candidatus Pantoea edessiphila]
MTDELYMAHALKLAKRGCFTTTPNPNVGCVIVLHGNIVGEGWHQKAGGNHAEIHALHAAGDKARGSTVYVTLEPCSHHGLTPPCCQALIDAGVDRVVVAAQDPNPKVSGKGFIFLKQAGIKVSHGLMMKESKEINRGFFKRMVTGFPWVQLKFGISLDGCIAMNNGQSKWITSHHSRLDVQRYRAQSSAILSTSNTILADNPFLTVRWPQLKKDIEFIPDQKLLRQPIRVIMDRQNQVTPKHKIINQPGETWLIRQSHDNQCWPNNVVQMILPVNKQKINLSEMLLLLGKNQINNILVEAGAKFAGALIQDNMIDELIIYIAPKILGDSSIRFCKLPNLIDLNSTPKFSFTDICKIGSDIRMTLIPEEQKSI